LAAVVAAGSVLWCATAGASGPLRPFKHGFWSGGAYVDERSGAFTHCSAGVAYDSGINLFVLVTGGYRWWLGLINSKWQLTPTARAAIKLALDDGPPFDGQASIPNGQLLLVSLPDSSKLLAAFRRSSKLALDAEGQTYSFKLDGTPAVMDELANCVRTSLALAAQMPPTAPLPAATPDAGAATAAAGADAAPPPSSASLAASSETAPAEIARAAVAPVPTAAVQPAIPAAPTLAVRSTAPTAPQQAAAQPPSGARSHDPTAPARPTAGTSSVRTVAAASSSPASAMAGLPPPPATQTAATTASRAAPGAEQAGERATGLVATTPAWSSAAEPQDTAAPSGLPGSATPPPLAFTSAPALPPAASPAGPSSAVATSQLPPGALSPTAIEEVRLATDFVAKARLPDARLVVEDKPAALADFNAVWRAEGGAGAVKIIQPGRDVTGIRIASDLIAVDPQLCKGDFSAARFRTDVGSRVVFSAVLSCSEANEDRVTEYFVTPRHHGGFVVFAVIRSKAAGDRPGFDWQKIDVLSRAAIEAAESQG
jgi:hypothetical protein